MSATPGKSFTNPHLSDLPSDHLYHIGFRTDEHDLKDLFSDVKFVVMGGSAKRMASFAELVAEKIVPKQKVLEMTKTDRYSFYKIGPVISVSHGMGVPSITILLHEIIKLLQYAEAKDPIIIRIGTCGGLGITPGTVVISERSLNSSLREEHDTVILGKVVSRPSRLDKELAEEVMKSHADQTFRVVLGTTMCTDDFYEGQARIDGAVCDYDKSKQQEYLQMLKEKGVDNIEMECSAMAALCHKANVRCAIVCVVLVDRLQGDQVDPPREDYDKWQLQLQNLVVQYIKKRLPELKNPVV